MFHTSIMIHTMCSYYEIFFIFIELYLCNCMYNIARIVATINRNYKIAKLMHKYEYPR